MPIQNEYRIRVTGARELRKEAKRVAGKGGSDAIKAANKQAAELVADHAKASTVPIKSGDLKNNIRPTATAASARVQAGSTKKVGDYAGVIHFGDPKRNIKPQMYLSDAVHDEWPVVYSFYEKEIQQIADSLSTK